MVALGNEPVQALWQTGLALCCLLNGVVHWSTLNALISSLVLSVQAKRRWMRHWHVEGHMKTQESGQDCFTVTVWSPEWCSSCKLWRKLSFVCNFASMCKELLCCQLENCNYCIIFSGEWCHSVTLHEKNIICFSLLSVLTKVLLQKEKLLKE